jgi:hypothetical protein
VEGDEVQRRDCGSQAETQGLWRAAVAALRIGDVKKALQLSLLLERTVEALKALHPQGKDPQAVSRDGKCIFRTVLLCFIVLGFAKCGAVWCPIVFYCFVLPYLLLTNNMHDVIQCGAIQIRTTINNNTKILSSFLSSLK